MWFKRWLAASCWRWFKSDDVSCVAGAMGAGRSDGFSLQLSTSYVAPTLSSVQNVLVASNPGVVLTQRSPGILHFYFILFVIFCFVLLSLRRRCVRPFVRPCVRDSRGSFMFPRYLQYLLTDFRQTFVTGASRDRDELFRFWGQKVKGQGHCMTEYIPDFYVSAISPVSVDGFSPNFCHWCTLDTDDLITFLGQKVKVQGHTIAAEAHSTRRYSTLPSSATFSSSSLVIKLSRWLYKTLYFQSAFSAAP